MREQTDTARALLDEVQFIHRPIEYMCIYICVYMSGVKL